MSSDSKDNSLLNDRFDAATKLCDTISNELLESEDLIIIGVSKEGVFYADRVARRCKAGFDILLTEPIKAPNNNEVDIAMISETQEVVIHKALVEAFDIGEDFLYAEAQRKYDEVVLSHLYRYRKGGELQNLEHKKVLLVDECIETGLTMLTAIQSAIAAGAKNIYVAVPIVDKSVYAFVLNYCDDLYTAHKIEHYVEVESYFKHYEQPSDEEIMEIIEYRLGKYVGETGKKESNKKE